MQRIFIIIVSCFFLTGCSLLPRLTFSTPNTVPQQIDKSKVKEVCKGKAEWDNNGNIISCSKGYYHYNQVYGKQERKMTIIERVKSFFNTILGWGIPGLIIILVLFPGAFTLIGTFIGRFLEGSFGMAKVVSKKLMQAIQKVRKEGKNLEDTLEKELDQKEKDYIKKVKSKESIK